VHRATSNVGDKGSQRHIQHTLIHVISKHKDNPLRRWQTAIKANLLN